MPTKHARDIMIPLDKYPHVPYWFTIRQAIAEMEMSTIEMKGKKSLPRAILVFDETYQLMGVVRHHDIFKGLEPDFLRTMAVQHRKQMFNLEADPNLVDLSSGKIAGAIEERANIPVSEIMQPIVSIVEYDDHLAKLIYLMITRDINLLPVIRDNNIVGVVRSIDVFHELAHVVL
ncbi:MAG: CBS domain-containing protein [Candidatus Electryonea clarkiae]|nr:CBS domain-containing protein [Candidatus Electryonea clarkiae]MDP8288519.1 CBS domain-containing protein [Candidatus Electryonea clarkiae]